MSEKREKFYTVSARLVFSSIMVLLIVALILGVSIAINKGPITPLLGIGGRAVTTSVAPILVSVVCNPDSSFKCLYPSFNFTTGVLTVALSQDTGYNWTAVTVRFIPSNTTYSHGVPIVTWSPPGAANVTGGLLSNQTKYVNIPITSGPASVGTNITGSIWGKYQIEVGGTVFYANMSSAVIVIKQG